MTADSKEGSSSASLFNRKLLIVIGLVLVGILLLHFSPLYGFRENINEARETLAGYGAWATSFFFLLTALGVAFGLSRLAFCFIGGMAFGFITGGSLALAGSLLGAFLNFSLLKWWGGAWAANLSGRLGRWRDKIKDPDIFSIILIRQLPITGLVLNAGFAFGGTRPLRFILGTLLGYLPHTIVFTLLGSGLGKDSAVLALLQILFAILFVILFGVVAWRYLTRDKTKFH